MPEIPNYCKSENGLSICTAGDDWRDCHFVQKSVNFDRCLFFTEIAHDFFHCWCVEAQQESRGVKLEAKDTYHLH